MNTPRQIVSADMKPLARLWHESWHRAHDAYVPQALIDTRTMAEFAGRLPGLASATRVIGPEGDPLGLCTIKGNELNQLFIKKTAEGTGIAQTLLLDGEDRLAALGHQEVWLCVVPENERACRFYQRAGWTPDGYESVPLATATGTFALDSLIFRKTLPSI